MRDSEALLAVFAVLSVGLRSSGAPGELRGNAAGSESSAAVWTTCPNRCRCEEERADCSDLGLREVPSNLSVFTSYLDLSMNNLSDMSSGGLSNLPFLEELRLAGNDLSFIPRGAFSGLFNLKVLMLQNNQLKSVPADAFNNLHNLQSLHLDANHISSVPPGCFSGLRSLRHLWLDDNSLTEVPVAALSELPTLQAMTLALNRISHVPDHAFSKLGRLVVLHLNNNRIVSMGTSCFHGLWSLETLDLNYNSLVEFPSAVRSLRNLKELGFHSNNIQSIPEHAFTGNPSLISIFFYNNPIQSVGRSAFQNLPELRTLSLNGAANLTEFPDLTGTKRLESLTITEARITHLPASVCDQLPNLQLLDLSFNRIQIVPSFSGCENIQKIDLHHNEIKELKENTFTGLMSLRSLDLSWNRLFSVEPDSFSVLPALSKLDLSSNQLSSLPLTGLQSLTHIRLAGNNQLMDLIPREDLPRVRVMELPYAFQCCAFVSSSSLAFSVSLVLFDLLCFLIMTFAYIRLYCRANKAPPPSEEEVALIRHVAWLLFSDSLLFLPVAFLSFSSLLRLPVAGPEAAKGVLLLVAPLPACVNPLLYLLFTPLAREELAALTKRTCVGTLALKLRRRGAAEGRQLDSTYDDDAEKQSCDSTQALVVVEGVKEEDEGEGRGRGGSKTHQSGAFVAKRH